jgi:hypothetical protein
MMNTSHAKPFYGTLIEKVSRSNQASEQIKLKLKCNHGGILLFRIVTSYPA